MQSKITNIVLEGNRFRVWAIINGIEEQMLFMPDVTSEDIKKWEEEREQYYVELAIKEEQLKQELGVE